MSLSFKKYADFLSREGDLSDEQINEIFGIFKNNEKVEKLKAEREKLKKDTAKKVADWREKKELEAAAKAANAKNNQARPAYAGGPRSAGAAGRAAERDWLTNMNEGKVGGFTAFEPLDFNDLENFNIARPKSGKALIATYKGAKNDVFLTLGVDPDEKRIRVSIENMFRGSSRTKYFDDDAEGYKKAKAYAEELRNSKVKINEAPVGKDWKVQYAYADPSGSGIASGSIIIRSAHTGEQAKDLAKKQLARKKLKDLVITRATLMKKVTESDETGKKFEFSCQCAAYNYPSHVEDKVIDTLEKKGEYSAGSEAKVNRDLKDVVERVNKELAKEKFPSIVIDSLSIGISYSNSDEDDDYEDENMFPRAGSNGQDYVTGTFKVAADISEKTASDIAMIIGSVLYGQYCDHADASLT